MNKNNLENLYTHYPDTSFGEWDYFYHSLYGEKEQKKKNWI